MNIFSAKHRTGTYDAHTDGTRACSYGQRIHHVLRPVGSQGSGRAHGTGQHHGFGRHQQGVQKVSRLFECVSTVGDDHRLHF